MEGGTSIAGFFTTLVDFLGGNAAKFNFNLFFASSEIATKRSSGSVAALTSPVNCATGLFFLAAYFLEFGDSILPLPSKASVSDAVSVESESNARILKCPFDPSSMVSSRYDPVKGTDKLIVEDGDGGILMVSFSGCCEVMLEELGEDVTAGISDGVLLGVVRTVMEGNAWLVSWEVEEVLANFDRTLPTLPKGNKHGVFPSGLAAGQLGCNVSRHSASEVVWWHDNAATGSNDVWSTDSLGEIDIVQ